MIDLNIRVKNPTVWAIKGKALGLLHDMELDDGQTVVRPVPGVDVDYLGPVYVVDPTYDEEGNQISPGQVAQGQHYNIRIWGDDLQGTWEDNLLEILASPIAAPNKSETTYVWQGIEVLDMSTVETPKRVWL